MKKYSYELKGSWNKNSIKSKKFKNFNDATNSIEKFLAHKDLEVAYIISSDNSSTYVIDNYSRLILERI